MKSGFLMIIVLATSIMIPTSFAQESINCHFGDESTPLDNIFEKDLAVREFLKKYPNSTRLVTSDNTNLPSDNLKFTATNNSETETLTIRFYQNENGCYRPSDYNYSYDNGIIDVSITNSLSNFTKIINMIKSDNKKIEDFYPKNCNPIKLNYIMKGDSKPHFCKIDDSGSIVMSLQKHVGGPVEIQIPYKVMNALFYNCVEPNGYFVLVNGEEVDFEWTDNNNEGWYNIEVDLPPEYSKVEIIRTFQMNLTQEGFCGSIWSEHERYLSPSLQDRIGVEPQMIKCNDNLVLVTKNYDSPACVKPESVEKLFQRGFSHIPIGASFHVEKDCNDADGRKEAQCFKDAFESCTFAKANSVIHTIEGDAMYLESIIKADCQIHTTFDNTEDRFGGPNTGITRDVCNNVQLEEEHVWIIDDCTSGQEFQINYMGQDWELDKQCRDINGIWNYTYHNCTDLIDLETCEDNGGSLTCMPYEQMGNRRDVCRHVCNFDANTVDRK